MTRLLSTATLVMSIASAAAQAPPPAPTGIIRGRVVTTDGRPIKQAIVRALGTTARMQRGAATDSEGRFELKELAGGHVHHHGLPERLLRD
jgi:hypothetical protein